MTRTHAGNSLLGALALTALLLVCPVNPNVLCHVLGEAIWNSYGIPFAAILFSAVIVICAFGLVAGRRADFGRVADVASVLAISAVVGYSIPLIVQWLDLSAGASAFLVGSAVLLGLGTVTAVLVWALLFAGMGVGRAFAVFSGCFLASAVVRVVLEGIPYANAAIVYGVAAAVGFCLMPQINRWRQEVRDDSASGSAEAGPTAQDDRLFSETRERRHATIAALLPLFAGLGALGLVTMLGATPTSSPDWFSLGLIGASLVTLVALWWRKDGAPVFLARICLPALAILMLAVAAAPLPAVLQDRISRAFLYVVLGLTVIGALSFMCGIKSQRRMGLAALLALLVYCAAALFGVGLIAVSGNGIDSNALVYALGLVLVVLMVGATLVLPSDKADSLNPHTHSSSAEADVFEEVVRRTSERYALTERERSVLAYLGRGYSAAHIADQIGVSSSTVRTHCNNIYRKLGVNSKEEIVEFFEFQRQSMRP